MLTKNDLKQIDHLMGDRIKVVFKDFWDDILEPAFNNIHDKLTEHDQIFMSLEQAVSRLPTKEYVDDKFADFKKDRLLRK
jgi:hypothetical protein